MMLNKIKDFILNIIGFFYNKPEPVLGVQGYYWYKYCKRIVNNEIEEDNKNQYYEEWLEEFRTKTTDLEGNFPTREIAAEAFVEAIEDLQPKLCSELLEMGITNLE